MLNFSLTVLTRDGNIYWAEEHCFFQWYLGKSNCAMI